MGELLADFERPRARGSHRVYEYPGDRINGGPQSSSRRRIARFAVGRSR